MTKNEIRNEMRIKRDRYPYIHRDSMKIWDVLERQRLYEKAASLFAYSSFNSEVETRFILDGSWRRGKHLCLPRVEQKGIMDFYQLEGRQQLERNNYGIYEPSPRAVLRAPDAATLMLVPGVVFDRWGHRIGFGGGYYDRYLEKYPETVTMGVAFDFQILDEVLPTEKTDRSMQYLITPSGVYSVLEEAWI